MRSLLIFVTSRLPTPDSRLPTPDSRAPYPQPLRGPFSDSRPLIYHRSASPVPLLPPPLVMYQNMTQSALWERYYVPDHTFTIVFNVRIQRGEH